MTHRADLEWGGSCNGWWRREEVGGVMRSYVDDVLVGVLFFSGSRSHHELNSGQRPEGKGSALLQKAFVRAPLTCGCVGTVSNQVCNLTPRIPVLSLATLGLAATSSTTLPGFSACGSSYLSMGAAAAANACHTSTTRMRRRHMVPPRVNLPCRLWPVVSPPAGANTLSAPSLPATSSSACR